MLERSLLQDPNLTRFPCLRFEVSMLLGQRPGVHDAPSKLHCWKRGRSLERGGRLKGRIVGGGCIAERSSDCRVQGHWALQLGVSPAAEGCKWQQTVP
jgi:hypothetical protein